MTKVLIVYGTRYGATASTSEIIAATLQKEGFEVRVVDGEKDHVQSISEYDLIIVGSGIQMGKWTSKPGDFLKKNQMELSTKTVALFVSCGGANPLSEGEQKIRDMANCKKKYLEDKAVEFKVKPVALGFFGGCYDFNKMSWFFKRTLASIKPKLEAAGYKQSEAGLYDLRDLEAIRSWAKDLAENAKLQP